VNGLLAIMVVGKGEVTLCMCVCVCVCVCVCETYPVAVVDANGEFSQSVHPAAGDEVENLPVQHPPPPSGT